MSADPVKGFRKVCFTRSVVNPRHACAARVTVLVLMSVYTCLSAVRLCEGAW